MGCGAAEATGRTLFVLLLSTLVCCQSTELIVGFFVTSISSLTPHPLQQYSEQVPTIETNLSPSIATPATAAPANEEFQEQIEMLKAEVGCGGETLREGEKL